MKLKFEQKYLKLLGLVFIFISLFSFLSGFETYISGLEMLSLSSHNSDLSFNMINIKAKLLEKKIEVVSMYDKSNVGDISLEDLHYSSYIQLEQGKGLIKNSFKQIFKAFIVCIIGVILFFWKN